MDRALAAETVYLGSIPGQTKDYKNWWAKLPCLTFSNKIV